MTIDRSTIAAAVAAAACLVAGPAAAAPEMGREPVRVRIAHADLNLAGAAGRATLKTRIDRAVRQACRTSLPGLQGLADEARCRDEMRRDADVQVAALRSQPVVELAERR